MKKKISIIGGGASALMLACELDTKKFQVDIYERNQAPARKFLVAGDGGLNITHSENSESFLQRYTPSHFLSKAFAGFTNSDFIKWLHQKGIQTYTGSSGRVFPVKELKPVDVLTVILTYIKNNHVGVHTKHEWLGFTEHKEVVFKTDAGNKIVKSDYYVFCLGGASWPVTGSRGDWTNYFLQEGITINPFAASNCSFKINWPEKILNVIEGRALKNCVFTCNGKSNLGEAVLTIFGIEGSGVYPLSPQIREELNKFGEAKLFLDLKPNLSKAAILAKINQPKGKNNVTQHLVEQLNLNQTQLTLIKNFISKEDFLDAEKLSVKIKNLPLIINGTDSIDNAISSVGGIDLNEIDANFELKKLPNCFALGEMLDYDAPTGGYLLQSCFSMGHFLAQHLNSKG